MIIMTCSICKKLIDGYDYTVDFEKEPYPGGFIYQHRKCVENKKEDNQGEYYVSNKSS